MRAAVAADAAPARTSRGEEKNASERRREAGGGEVMLLGESGGGAEGCTRRTLFERVSASPRGGKEKYTGPLCVQVECARIRGF